MKNTIIKLLMGSKGYLVKNLVAAFVGFLSWLILKLNISVPEGWDIAVGTQASFVFLWMVESFLAHLNKEGIKDMQSSLKTIVKKVEIDGWAGEITVRAAETATEKAAVKK